MNYHDIKITDCEASPLSEPVRRDDAVRFYSGDKRSYKLTGLGNVFEGAPGHIDVPAGPCNAYYRVIGKNGVYKYNIQGKPACSRERGTPDIIIVN